MYASTVNGKKLTLAVSGKLWNRSLIMIDSETKSLWSHILGEAMEGPMKGAYLTPIASDMVTWKAWKESHPDSTVLNLKRTRNDYTVDFYRRPARFVVGWIENKVHHVGFDSLKSNPLQNITTSEPLVVTFNSSSSSARIFKRKLDGELLNFKRHSETTMTDEQTNSVWNKSTGTALAGKLKGKSLIAVVGIVSYRGVWLRFHPASSTPTVGQ